MLGVFYGALSPGVLYIGHKLNSRIPISVIAKYRYFKIMVISFRMLYHYTRRTTKLLGEGYIGFTPSVRPGFRVRSLTPTVLDGFFLY